MEIAISFFILLISLFSRKEISIPLLGFIIPFSQSMEFFAIGGRTINLGMDTIYILGLMLRSLLSSNKLSINFTSDVKCIIILMLWFMATILVNIFKHEENTFVEASAVYLRIFQYVILYIYIRQQKILAINRCLFWVVAAALMGSLIAINQSINGISIYFKGAPSFTLPMFRELNLEDVIGQGGLYEGSANYNVAGAYMMSCGILSLLLTRLANKSIAILSVLTIATGVYLTHSRSAIITMLILIAYYFTSQNYKNKIYAAFLLLIILLSTLYIKLENNFINDMLSLYQYIDIAIYDVLNGNGWESGNHIPATVYGAAMRIVGIRDSLYIFMDNPIIGCGFSEYKYCGYNNTPDSYFFQILAETGIIGLAISLWFYFLPFRYSKARRRNGSNIFLMFFASLLIVNLSGGLFYIQKIWGLYLYILALYFYYNDKQEKFL